MLVRDINPPKKIIKIKAHTSKYFGGFGAHCEKILAAILILAINWWSLPSITSTFSYMLDREISQPEIINLGTLDFVTATTTAEALIEIRSNEKSIHHVILQNTGNLPFQYRVGVDVTGGDENVCEFLQLEAFMNDQPQYVGGLINFATLPIEYATSTAEWEFNVSFPADALQNIGQGQNCDFEFIFDAWQLAAQNPDAGFFDQEEISGKVKILKDAPSVKVEYPNGGEHWYIVDNRCVTYDWCRAWCVSQGMNDKCEYKILWDAKIDGGNSDNNLLIDIWYSTDSGQTWLAKIADSVSNNGKFKWKIPYDNRFISDKARIKVVATDKQTPALWNYDISDADFCPPMLSIEDLMNRDFGAGQADGGAGVELPATQDVVMLSTVEMIPMTIEQINSEIAQIQNATTTLESNQESGAININKTEEEQEAIIDQKQGNENQDAAPVQNPIVEIPAFLTQNDSAAKNESLAESAAPEIK